MHLGSRFHSFQILREPNQKPFMYRCGGAACYAAWSDIHGHRKEPQEVGRPILAAATQGQL